MAEETKVETLDERILRETTDSIPKIETKVNASPFYVVKESDKFTGNQIAEVISKIIAGKWNDKPAYETMDLGVKTVERDDDGTGFTIRIYDTRLQDGKQAAYYGDIGCRVAAGDNHEQIIRDDKKYNFGEMVLVAAPTVEPEFDSFHDGGLYTRYTYDQLSDLAKAIAYDLAEKIGCTPKKVK